MSRHDFELPEDVAAALGLAPAPDREITPHGGGAAVPPGLRRWAARRRTSAAAVEFGWRMLRAPGLAFRRLASALVAATEGLAFTRDAAAVQVMFK